ncbi:phosphonate C-P lyase system protein PhnL [Roseomonas sp. CECT 9278]|uniref:phosphonate C-P lyase system protein PhnL n=1 Tax=Roseomonas sp. CECT 9278 TaxID=2845823 RepID=UPI001E3B3ECA|nr:phosphonate C-P lyase system protein PhnL [Roseomonas sp. CECT 9278]CAH0205138.1 Alpha-D-ribose 1-methylphosphonate 5-triphosphate synthase subunit PhnL [Roseomonas sp. CECT 9278]
MSAALRTEGLGKAFTLHLQGGVRIPVLGGVDLAVHAGECVALWGPSGAGKSTLMRCLYGNYGAGGGRILLRHRNGELDLATATPQQVIEARRETMGYVSQFLRVIPRVATRDIVAEPLITRGMAREDAAARATDLLHRLNLPDRLHGLPPATFSGGEQQRVNLARGFAPHYPVLLLDEPTASLDAANRAVVIGLIRQAKAEGSAIIGIFHDTEVREAVADRLYDVLPQQDAA